MVVVWGNILSLIGNAFAQAVEILVFDPFIAIWAIPSPLCRIHTTS